MSETPQPSPLNYRDPRDDRSRRRDYTRVAAGIVIGWGSLFGLQIFWVLANFGIVRAADTNWVVPSIVSAVVLAAIGAMAFVMERRLGVLFLKAVGVGVILCLLMDGVCYLSTR